MIYWKLQNKIKYKPARMALFCFTLTFIITHAAVYAKHRAAVDYSICDKFINQWTDKKNGAIPENLRDNIIQYLGKDVDYPEPVNKNTAHYFTAVQSEEDKQFKEVPLTMAAECGIATQTLAAGGPIETYFSSSPVTLKLKSLKTAVIQGHELYIGDYWDKNDDHEVYLNLYEKDKIGAIKELVHGAGAINVFVLGNNSPVFIAQKWQTFNAFVQGDVSRLMDDGSLKKLATLWDMGINWDIFDICGEGMQQFIVSIRVPRPQFPKKLAYCVNSGHCCLRKLVIYKWDGTQLKKEYNYFYTESPDVVR